MTRRDVWLTRADEDRLCDKLEKLYPGLLVVADGRKGQPQFPVRRRISEFSAAYWRSDPDAQTDVVVVVPWPGWEPRARQVTDSTGRTFEAYELADEPPLAIQLMRSFMYEDRYSPDAKEPDDPWALHGMNLAFLTINFDSDGPYVEAQTKWRRDVYRILRKMTSNRLLELLLELKRDTGGPTRIVGRRPLLKGAPLWYGEDAARWAREDERRFFTLEFRTEPFPQVWRPYDEQRCNCRVASRLALCGDHAVYLHCPGAGP